MVIMISKFKLISCYFCICAISQTHQANDPGVKLYGPGLDPVNIILPARYITIELNKEYNETKKLDFIAKGYAITNGQDQRPCRIWHNILDRKGGSYIVRYKLYEPCINFLLEFTYGGHHIAHSPYKYGHKIIYHELCHCPRDITNWLKTISCDVPEQIHMDLQFFKTIDWEILRSKVIKRFDKPEAISICHYVILNNSLFRTCYGKHVGFKIFMDNILLSLLRKVLLPNMEFFVNLGDWPLVKDNVVPVFSWCGSEDTYDIVMPTYDITESTLENMGRVTLDMLSVQGNAALHWDQRVPKAFWRGRDSNPTRLTLMDIARDNPTLFNVSMTNFFFYRDKQEKYGPKTPHVSFYKFFDYKYQVSIDGTVAAYRFPYLLGGGSLILKQNSKYYEHFYHMLKPHDHYIPIEEDLSDIVEQVQWANENDAEVRKITQNALKFANEHLLPNNIICYYVQLLNEYSKLVVSRVKVLEGMEEVPQPIESQNCHCEQNTEQTRDEL